MATSEQPVMMCRLPKVPPDARTERRLSRLAASDLGKAVEVAIEADYRLYALSLHVRDRQGVDEVKAGRGVDLERAEVGGTVGKTKTAETKDDSERRRDVRAWEIVQAL